MNVYAPEVLQKAVAAVCPDIFDRVSNNGVPGERALWWELSSCILSSQVPYDLAVAATNAIDGEGLLVDQRCDAETLMLRITKVLSKPLSVAGRLRAYRFPVIRSCQLAATYAAVISEAPTLRDLIDGFYDAPSARTWFVDFAPGMGPKQASMFLRNVGVSYDLAILDRHVLNYMSALDIYTGTASSISGLAKYRQYENVLRDHAERLGCPVGVLDWAIWIVMRVANRNAEPIAA